MERAKIHTYYYYCRKLETLEHRQFARINKKRHLDIAKPARKSCATIIDETSPKLENVLKKGELP